MSTDTETRPDTIPQAFADLPLREKHLVVAKLLAFEAAFKETLAQVRAVYGDTLHAAYQEGGSKTFSVRLDDDGNGVDLTLRETQDSYKVIDPQAFADHVEEHHPGVGGEVVFKVHEAFQKQYLKGLREVTIPAEVEGEPDRTVIIDADGLEVPGVKFDKGGISKSFGPSWKKDGKQVVLNQLWSESIPDVLPAITAGGDQ